MRQGPASTAGAHGPVCEMLLLSLGGYLAISGMRGLFGLFGQVTAAIYHAARLWEPLPGGEVAKKIQPMFCLGWLDGSLINDYDLSCRDMCVCE